VREYGTRLLHTGRFALTKPNQLFLKHDRQCVADLLRTLAPYKRGGGYAFEYIPMLLGSAINILRHTEPNGWNLPTLLPEVGFPDPLAELEKRLASTGQQSARRGKWAEWTLSIPFRMPSGLSVGAIGNRPECADTLKIRYCRLVFSWQTSVLQKLHLAAMRLANEQYHRDIRVLPQDLDYSAVLISRTHAPTQEKAIASLFESVKIFRGMLELQVSTRSRTLPGPYSRRQYSVCPWYLLEGADGTSFSDIHFLPAFELQSSHDSQLRFDDKAKQELSRLYDSLNVIKCKALRLRADNCLGMYCEALDQVSIRTAFVYLWQLTEILGFQEHGGDFGDRFVHLSTSQPFSLKATRRVFCKLRDTRNKLMHRGFWDGITADHFECLRHLCESAIKRFIELSAKCSTEQVLFHFLNAHSWPNDKRRAMAEVLLHLVVPHDSAVASGVAPPNDATKSTAVEI